MQLYRIMALDVGDVRIGIAATDLLQTIASPLESYRRKGFLKDIDYILRLAAEREVGLIVSGLPLSDDGTENAQCEKVREFISALADRTEIPVQYMDERCTTVAAEELLIDADVSRAGRKRVVDKIAAALILERYLSERERDRRRAETSSGKQNPENFDETV